MGADMTLAHDLERRSATDGYVANIRVVDDRGGRIFFSDDSGSVTP